jgi:hypothetical protein
MKKIVFGLLTFGAIFLGSCQKDKGVIDSASDNGRTDLPGPGTGKASLKSPRFVIYQISDEALKDSTEAFIANFQNTSSVTGRPSACGRLLESTSIIESISHTGSFCDNTAIVSVVYRFISIEWGNPGTYTFSVGWPGSTATSVIINELPPVDISTPLNWYTARTYRVQATMSNAEYNMAGGSTNTVTRTGDGITCVAETDNSYTPFVFPASYYVSSPAFIYIFPNSPNHGIFVANQCNALLCYPPYITCPDAGGTFKYRLVATPTLPWITLTMNTAFYVNGITGLAPGTYEYECTLIYGGSNTLPATGTFVIP